MTTPAPELVLSERYGDYRTNWYCEPPPMHVPFQCLRDEWSWSGDAHRGGESELVRSVFEIRVTIRPGELYARLTAADGGE